MSSNAIKLIAAVLVAITIVLLVVVFQMSRNYAENASKASQQVQATTAQTQVVVALKPLLADQPITKDEVALVPVQVAPQDYFANVDDVVNRVPLIDVDAGSPVTPRYFKESNQLARLIPPGHKAVSLALTDVVGVGGFVRPGDIVDVLVYLRNDQTNKIDPAQARILLRDALVLASDDRIVSPPQGSQAQNQNQNQNQQQAGRHERTVVVAVPDEEVTRVMLGANLGEVRLALHPQAQTQVAGTPPQAPEPLPPGPEADRPVTSAELAQLKPKSKHAGIVIYHGSTPSTVFP
jgi:pilus assembly protein CpaB